MKLGIKLSLLASLLAGVAILGPGFCVTGYAKKQSPNFAADGNPQMIQRSVVKVHTDRGVITLPGRADSWEEAENAVFLADSIADVQMVNNEVPWRIDYE